MQLVGSPGRNYMQYYAVPSRAEGSAPVAPEVDQKSSLQHKCKWTCSSNLKKEGAKWAGWRGSHQGNWEQRGSWWNPWEKEIGTSRKVAVGGAAERFSSLIPCGSLAPVAIVRQSVCFDLFPSFALGPPLSPGAAPASLAWAAP